MLRVFETGNELKEAELLTSDSIFLLPIHYSIRHERLGVFPEAKCTILGYPEKSPFIWMVIRRNKFTRLFAGRKYNSIFKFMRHFPDIFVQLSL
ncbi:unnamed protein product [Brugia timori]|uniref:Transcriptional regulator n=1 Tax=Brugia timori TaxID=42155 RepID=A0A0R3QDZ9_9BILA|nr:unnamed protein product [Brugia timori]